MKTPEELQLEFHLTYACNLACTCCNRASSFYPWHTPPFTLAWLTDRAFYLRDRMPNVDRIVALGGEPTVHPDCVAMCRVLRVAWPKADAIILSNEYSQESRDIVEQLTGEGWRRDPVSTAKPGGSVQHFQQAIYLSPEDGGQARLPCRWQDQCGWSVDSAGLTSCAIGGMIDAVLGLGLRTWDTDKVKTRDDLKELCRHCGSLMDGVPFNGEILGFKGQKVSRTWHERLVCLEKARTSRT